jgi:hypothetical protein
MFQPVMNNQWTNLLLLCLVEVYGDFKFKAYARSSGDGLDAQVTPVSFIS